MRPANASNAVLFPALKNIALSCVHSGILGDGLMPSLENLRLKGLTGRLLFSQLFSLLYKSPALRTLTIHLTLPTIDLLAPIPASLASLPQLFPNGPLRCTRFRLRHLVYLSLIMNPAPPSNLALLFLLLDLPALSGLDLHIHTDLPVAHWPCVTPDGGTTTILHSSPTPRAQIGRLPSLCVLHVTYCITPAFASSSTPTTGAPAPAPFPKAQNIAFPALNDLRIAHGFARDPSRAQDTATPQLPPPPPPLLQPFDALFHAPDSDFAHLTRLALAHCALPLGTLCSALWTRAPALEVLVLEACPGAGALVCALAPGECVGAHEHEHKGKPEGEGKRGRGVAGTWVGRGVREVAVVRCVDVRAGCLRRVVEARLRAGGSETTTSTGACGGASAVLVSSPGRPTAFPEPARPSSSAGGECSSELEDERMDERRPHRIAVLRIVQCARVTRDEAQALAAIPGAPRVVWSGN